MTSLPLTNESHIQCMVVHDFLDLVEKLYLLLNSNVNVNVIIVIKIFFIFLGFSVLGNVLYLYLSIKLSPIKFESTKSRRYLLKFNPVIEFKKGNLEIRNILRD